ncbi:hypothetical protein M758_N002900 [Ceratodon purpureus]|nr:hypothetical protein M758_N002900 [Ceratodon purpureus]
MPEVVELYVVMHCEACAASVKRAIKKIPGVESYKIDYYEQKVTVIGDVTREDVWRRIHKTGKRVTLIPKPAPPKDEPKEEKKEETKEEKKEEEETKEEKTEEEQETKVEITEVKVEEKKQEKSEESKEETKVVDTKETTVVVRRKSMYWPAVRLWRFLIPREVKVHETKEEVVTVVETKDEKKEETKEEKKEEAKEEKKEEPKSEEKKQPKRPKEPEWMPMFVSAPYYTLPSRFY